MRLVELFSLQGSLFLLMLAGLFLKRRGIIDDAGKRCLTDLCIGIIIPCNIIKSCMMELEPSVLQTCGLLLIAAIFSQLLCLVLNQLLYNRFPEQQKKVLQYATIVSNSSFLGYPVAEAVYGSMGLLYSSVFLIPMRVVMWSAGTSYFVAGAHMSKKELVKNVLTHPCLVAVYIGMLLMVFQIPVPQLLRLPIQYIGNCNSAITMFIVGTILAGANPKRLFNRATVLLSVLRLALLPLAVLGICRVLGLDSVSTGIAVIMIGMPAGATVSIFAEKYGSDADFANGCVVLTTLLSMFTIPLWIYRIG